MADDFEKPYRPDEPRLENRTGEEQTEGLPTKAPTPANKGTLVPKRRLDSAVATDGCKATTMELHGTQAVADKETTISQNNTEAQKTMEAQRKIEDEKRSLQMARIQLLSLPLQSNRRPSGLRHAANPPPTEPHRPTGISRGRSRNQSQGQDDKHMDKLVEERARNMVLEQRLREAEAEIDRLDQRLRDLSKSEHQGYQFATRSKDRGSHGGRRRETGRRRSPSSDDSEQHRRSHGRSERDGHLQQRTSKRRRYSSTDDSEEYREERRSSRRSPDDLHDKKQASKRARSSPHEERHGAERIQRSPRRERPSNRRRHDHKDSYRPN